MAEVAMPAFSSSRAAASWLLANSNAAVSESVRMKDL